MLWMMLLAQIATLGANNYAADAPMAPPPREPAITDEFEQPAIDVRLWRYDTALNAHGWANNERQYYSADRTENARIEDGALVIEARKEPVDKARFPDSGGQDYTSARLVSRPAMGYGFYEVRAKLPCGRGTWPAIWMLPASGPWPDEGEIDIMEMVGWDAGTVHGTVHSGTYNHRLNTQRGAQIAVPDACTAFHRYQLDWQPHRLRVGMDGRAYMEVRDNQPGGDKGPRGAWPFDRPYQMILNLAIGGDWGGQQGIDDAALPQRMTVDYVRYWPALAAVTAASSTP